MGVNAANVWSGVRPLVVSRNKAAMGSLDEAELANKFPSVTNTNFYKSLIWVPKLCAPINHKTISKLLYNSLWEIAVTYLSILNISVAHACRKLFTSIILNHLWIHYC